MEYPTEHALTVKTAYTHYWITGTEPDPGDDLPESTAARRAGERASLLSPSGTHPALIVATGVQYGDIPAIVRIHPAEPPVDTSEEWEEIAEGDLEAGPVVILGNLDGCAAVLPLADEHAAERTWRVRVSVRGADDTRATAYAAEGDPLSEHHLIELWPGGGTGLRYLRRDPRSWRGPAE